MKRYKIIKPIVLAFSTPNDHEELIEPKHNVILESDGSTVWAIHEDKRHESTTMANIIDVGMTQGLILEI